LNLFERPVHDVALVSAATAGLAKLWKRTK
jgi:hypothetical protein